MMSSEEIAFVESFLGPTTVVLEWGAGGSTLTFGPRCESWTSVEHDYQWAARVISALPESRQIRVIYEPPSRPVIPLLHDEAPYAVEYKDCFEGYVKNPLAAVVQDTDRSDVNLLLIDGRARLYCALECLRYPQLADAIVLIHDFRRRKRYWPVLVEYETISAVESGRSIVALKRRSRGDENQPAGRSA